MTQKRREDRSGAPTPSRVVRDRIRELRKRQEMSAQKLAERCADAGMPELNRSVIANIENGRRPSVSLDELLVLAYALNVAPVHLFVPVEPGAYVQVIPNSPLVDAETARTWVRGGRPLPLQDERRYALEKPAEEWRLEPTDEELREQFRRMMDVVFRSIPDDEKAELLRLADSPQHEERER